MASGTKLYVEHFNGDTWEMTERTQQGEIVSVWTYQTIPWQQDIDPPPNPPSERIKGDCGPPIDGVSEFTPWEWGQEELESPAPGHFRLKGVRTPSEL